jgi:ankyrin repeat protein
MLAAEPELFTRTDGRQRTLLHWAANAAYWDGRDVLRRLLDGGCPLEANDYKGRTALHYAAANWHGPAAKLLISRGADPDAEDNAGVTPRDVSWPEPGVWQSEVREQVQKAMAGM